MFLKDHESATETPGSEHLQCFEFLEHGKVGSWFFGTQVEISTPH